MSKNSIINLNNSIKAEFVKFTNGEILNNVMVFIMDNFVVISDENGTEEKPPVLYNINIIESIQLY